MLCIGTSKLLKDYIKCIDILISSRAVGRSLPISGVDNMAAL